MLEPEIPFPTDKLVSPIIFLPCVVTVFIVPKPIYSLTFETLHFSLTTFNLKNKKVSKLEIKVLCLMMINNLFRCIHLRT